MKGFSLFKYSIFESYERVNDEDVESLHSFSDNAGCHPDLYFKQSCL